MLVLWVWLVSVDRQRKTIYVFSRPLKSVNTWNRSPFWNALSREFRCRWCHLSCKLHPEIDNRFTFTLIKTTMRFKQIRKDIYRFWCQNGAILLISFWLNNESQIFPEKTQSVMDNLHILCLFTFHCTSWPIFITPLGNGNGIVFVLKLSNSLDNFQQEYLWAIYMI